MLETSAQTAADEAGLLENQVNELYRNSLVANLANVSIATVMGGILWTVADHRTLFAWYGYTLIIALAWTVITLRYRNASNPSANLQTWLNLHSAGVLLSGLGWGSLLLFIVPVTARFHLISTLFVISGLVTASAGSLASLRHGFAIFSIPAMIPGALKLIVLNQTESVLIGCFICIFLIFIAMVALRIHRVILYSFRTQFESARLVVLAQEENAALLARFTELQYQLEQSAEKLLSLQAALEQKNAEYAAVAEGADRRLKGERIHYLLDKLHGGAWNYSLKTGEIRFSPQWLDMLGYKEDEVYPSMDFWKSLLHPDERNEVFDSLHAHIAGKMPEYYSSHRLRARSGDWVWVFSRGQPVAWDTFGEVLNVVCVEIDIEDPAVHLAGKLPSTSFHAGEWLYTPDLFMQRLQYALQATALGDVRHALCHVSVDAQEDAGKELAEQLAGILVRECRHAGAVLDRGNNNFAVLLEHHPVDKALAKAAALRKAINAQHFIVDGRRIRVEARIGITPIFDMHKTIPEIFEDAETACNIASSNAQDDIFVFQRGNVEFDSGLFEKRILAKIRELLENKRLQLGVSTLKSLTNPGAATHRLFGLTATLPGLKNYAFPVHELHEAPENNALAIAFDLCTIELFHAWAAGQPKSYTEQQNVYLFECKLSSLLDEEFAIRVNQLFAHESLGKYFLCLLIAEPVFLAHEQRIRSLIDVLRPAGVKFALGNFGAGAFSCDALKHLPVDYLELSEDLVAGIESDTASALTIKYFNELGHVLNFRTIATCGDSKTQEAALGKAGVHFIRSATPEVHSLGVGGNTHSAAPAWLGAARPSASLGSE